MTISKIEARYQRLLLEAAPDVVTFRPRLQEEDVAELVEMALLDQMAPATRQWLEGHLYDAVHFDEKARALIAQVLAPQLDTYKMSKRVATAKQQRRATYLLKIRAEMIDLDKRLNSVGSASDALKRTAVLVARGGDESFAKKMRESAMHDELEAARAFADVRRRFEAYYEAQADVTDAFTKAEVTKTQRAINALRLHQITVEKALGGPEDLQAIELESRCIKLRQALPPKPPETAARTHFDAWNKKLEEIETLEREAEKVFVSTEASLLRRSNAGAESVAADIQALASITGKPADIRKQYDNIMEERLPPARADLAALQKEIEGRRLLKVPGAKATIDPVDEALNVPKLEGVGAWLSTQNN